MTEGESSSGPVNATSSPYSKTFIFLLFGGFVVTGAATVLLAPLLPLLAAKWALSDQAAGSLFTSQFLGSMVGTLLSGALIRRLGFARTLFLGYLCMGVYTVAVWQLPWPTLIALLSLNGLGLGLVIPATNMAVSDSFPQSRAAALNLINLSWSLGAIACPALLAVAKRSEKLSAVLTAMALTMFAVALLVVQSKTPRTGTRQQSSAGLIPPMPFVILALLFFLYIGAEGAVAGWLATYAKRTVLSAGVLWMTAPSFFWAAMMLGRAVAPAILKSVPERHLALAGLGISAAGVATIMAGESSISVLTGAAVAGLGMSGVFPSFIASVSQIFGEAANRVSPYMFAMAGLGGAMLPWMVGMISSNTGNLRVGLFVALSGVAAQMALSFLLFRRAGRTRRAS